MSTTAANTAAAEQTVTVAPARYEGWTISGRIEVARGVVALPVYFGSDDPARPLAEVYVKGWEGGTVPLNAEDLVGSVVAEGVRQWRGILNGF